MKVERGHWKRKWALGWAGVRKKDVIEYPSLKAEKGSWERGGKRQGPGAGWGSSTKTKYARK